MFNLADWLLVLTPVGALVLGGAAVVWRSRHARGLDDCDRILVVGTGPLAVQLLREIDGRPELRWRVLGVVTDLRPGEAPDAGPWLGPLDRLAAVIAATRPTRVITATAGGCGRQVEAALFDARLRGIAVEDAVHGLEAATGKLPIERLSPRTLLLGGGFDHSDFVPRDSTLVATRVLSTILAATGLVLLAPFLLLVALAIVADSRGPVFFSQRRIGMAGREFSLLKFRTMREAETRRSEWVSDNAHRVTRVGRWLRRFRIDELPQLINVLRGEMNLVGPRPHPASNYQLFLSRIPHYRLRTVVRPGITGWAQIRYGYANDLQQETEKMRYDLYYIKYRSLWFDLRILLQTGLVLLVDRRSHESARSARSDGSAVSASPEWLTRASCGSLASKS